jgi:hypothetical protein
MAEEVEWFVGIDWASQRHQARTNRAISESSSSARSGFRSRSFRPSFGPRPDDGSPECWRAEG